KSITPQPRPGHPAPSLVRIQTPEGPGLVNCNGFHNPGLAAYRFDIARVPHRVPLIVAAAGESAEDYLAVVEGLAPFRDPGGPTPFGARWGTTSRPPNPSVWDGGRGRPAEPAAMFRAGRKATDKPIIVKVSPDFRGVNEEATIPAALDAGITIVNSGNTRRIDEPRLSQKTGGLSGPALFTETLTNVRRLRQRFGDSVQIVATGGIDAPDKARQALEAGATACAYFTGFITRGPLLARRILDALVKAKK